MNNQKFIRISLLFPLLLSCSDKKDIINTPSFRFNEINVEQNDSKGVKQFEFETMKAKIEESTKSVEAKDSTVILYQSEKPFYKLESKSSILINNGEKVQLNEGVEMISLLNNDLSIKANSITWIKDSSEASIHGKIKAKIKGSSFTSKKAIYNHIKNTIDFKGIKKYNYNNKSGDETIEIFAKNALCDGKNNKLIFTNKKEQVLTRIRIAK